MMKDKVILSNESVEALLRSIPAGWTLAFSRQLLRPDVIEMAIIRPDRVRVGVKTTGGLLLENRMNDFLDVIRDGARNLMQAKKK